MRTIIAGSRNFLDYEKVLEICKEHDITVILSGTARGADQLGIRFAREFNIPLEEYPAQWDLYGKAAGYERNMLMAQKAEALIAFWDGGSPGTKHMIDVAKAYKLKTTVEII